MNALDVIDLHKNLDGMLKLAVRANKFDVTCSKGCFACCKELAIASRPEIRFILSQLSGTAKAALSLKVEQWLAKFLSAGGMNSLTGTPERALEYLKFNLYCPLLNDQGCCSVYEHRPCECRLFCTAGDPKACADPALRPEQMFLVAPGIHREMMKYFVNCLGDGETTEFDHIGIILAEELLGGSYVTKCRLRLHRNGSTLEIQRCDVENDE